MKKLIVFSLLSSLVFFYGCKKDKLAQGTDADLYEMAQETKGFTWYKKTNALLPKSTGTGHSQPYLRTRYNDIASTHLGSDGKILSGTTFTEGSLIVKELYSDMNTFDRYAILYKNSSSPNADAKGWVWGYINADGSVAFEASKKGSSCTGCHSQADNIDYMLMNKFFP